MKYLVSVLLFMCLCYLGASQTWPPPFSEKCEHSKYPPKVKEKVPTFEVNLDLNPIQRWDMVAKHMAPQIRNLVDTFKKFALSISKKAEYVIKLVDSDLGYLLDSMPEPFASEMRGISKMTGIPEGEIVMYNIFYEIFTVCTSLMAFDNNGKMYHARNLDFGLFLGWEADNHTWMITEALRPAIVNLDWKRNNVTVFKSVNFAGFVGILTAVKPKLFTLTMNERFNIDGGYIGILKWLMGEQDMNWMGFLTRSVMENSTSYKDALDKLSHKKLLAPAYFILGGTNKAEGAIITRSREGPEDIWHMGTRNSTWFLVETNYDNWKPPFFIDDRRTPAIRCMNKLGQANVGFSGIFDVLSSQPMLNKLTTYTALLQVDEGIVETYLQYCPDPCFPF